MPPPRNPLASLNPPSGAKIIALMNFKGGVGKTTVAVNLAAAMAHRLKKRVLLLDLDPQCSATLWLMTRDEWFEARAEKLTISDLFNAAAVGATCDERFLKKIIRPVAEHEGRAFDLVPSSIDLLELERNSTD